MMSFIPPRLRKPGLAMLAGVLFAAAWLVRGGLVRVGGRGPGPDRGGWPRGHALPAGRRRYRRGCAGRLRADERQQLVGLKSRALACNIAVIAAFIGLCAGIAAKASWWWPFLAILAVAGFGYLLGLSSYGSGEPEADDDADAGLPARSPAQG